MTLSPIAAMLCVAEQHEVLLSALQASRDALRAVEWSASLGIEQHPICPMCGGWKPRTSSDYAIGHATDCTIVVALDLATLALATAGQDGDRAADGVASPSTPHDPDPEPHHGR